MNQKYVFRQATLTDLDRIQELIDQRIAWMDKVGIKQWNVTKYNERYPRSYYIKNLNDFYVLTDNEKVVCAGTLYKEDDRWNKKGSAYYIHHLVSEIGYKNLGYEFLDHALRKAKEDKMEYLRLDSAIDNEKLKKYYTDYGFKPVGTCIDGLYEGILREIKL